MSEKLYNDTYSVKPHLSRITKCNDGYGDWREGYVWTQYGAVGVYSQGGDECEFSSTFEFAFGERVYVRRIKKKYATRGLIIEAKKFAKEITEYFNETKMKNINNEEVLYENGYLGYAVTTSECPVCGTDVNIYLIKNKPAKKVFSACWFDLREILPTLNQIVAGQIDKDRSAS